MIDKESDSVELRNLIDAGDWELLFENEAYKRLSRTGRIVMLRRALENREREYVKAYAGMIGGNVTQAKQFHDKKIKPLWEYQDFLDRCMMYFEAGGEKPGDAPEILKGLLD
jgi:hypothetical protein